MDYYLEDKSRLKGQPKRTIADYVEQNGILVPKRFNSLKEAKESDVPIICRSEHIQDYDGASGLLNSPLLEEFANINDKHVLREKLLEQNKYGIDNVSTFIDINPNTFKNEISFSYWEHLAGSNRTVVADSTIKRKYHITTFGEGRATYTILEENKIKNFGNSPKNSEKEFKGLVKLYEKIRNLDKFDSDNCPTMELQTFKGKHYFLQYMKGRNFNPPKFELKRWMKKGERKAMFVRGTTSSEGEIYNIAINHPDFVYEQPMPESEDGFYGKSEEEETYPEVMAKKWKLRIIPTLYKNVEGDLWDSVFMGHVSRSQLHKPEVSLIVNPDRFMTNSEVYNLKKGNEDKINYIKVFAISDGKNAYVKRV